MTREEWKELETIMSVDVPDMDKLKTLVLKIHDRHATPPMLANLALAFVGGDKILQTVEMHKVRAVMRTIPWMYAEDSRLYLQSY